MNGDRGAHAVKHVVVASGNQQESVLELVLPNVKVKVLGYSDVIQMYVQFGLIGQLGQHVQHPAAVVFAAESAHVRLVFLEYLDVRVRPERTTSATVKHVHTGLLGDHMESVQ